MDRGRLARVFGQRHRVCGLTASHQRGRGKCLKAVNVLQNFTPHADQKRVLASRKRWTIALAGVRGGKTFTCAAAFLNRILEDVVKGRCNAVTWDGSRHSRPKYHAWVCAPSYALLKEPKRYLLQLLPEAMIAKDQRTGRPMIFDNEIWLVNGVLIELKSTDDPKHLVSVGLNALWIDEADRVSADAWRGQLMTRLSDHRGWALFSSTPYAARAGYLWTDFISRKDEPASDIEFITWRFVDNPTNDLAELIAAKALLPERYFKREYEASLDAFVGLVFSLKDSEHLIDIPPQRNAFRRVIAGVDWGWNDPGAIIVLGDTGDRLFALDELSESHLPVIAPSGERSWVREAVALQAKWKIDTFLCDPSSPAYIHAFQTAGLSAIGAHNDIRIGVRRVDEQMHGGRLQIVGPNCAGLVEEMRNLQWATDKKTGQTKEEPEPGNDHRIDALRYGVMELRRYPDVGITPQRAMRRR